MKVLGVSVASLLLTGCRIPLPVTCYAPLPPSPYPTKPQTAKDRLRALWLRFNELAQTTNADYEKGDALSKQLVADHRAALDELVAAGELSAAEADLVQEAYTAAIYHVWRSNAPMTCYEPMIVDYAPTSAGVLVQQAETLNQIAGQGTIDPQTLANAKAALEHDMAFYALDDADVQALYDRLVSDWQANSQPVPSFEALPLELTPDAKTAAQFIIDLLSRK